MKKILVIILLTLFIASCRLGSITIELRKQPPEETHEETEFEVPE